MELDTLLHFIYTNTKIYGGYLFVGVCILIGALIIRSKD